MTREVDLSAAPITIRTQALSNKLDTIQNTLGLLEGDIKKGAIIALNAIRREYNIPELHDET